MNHNNRKLRLGVLGMTHDHVWDHLPDLAQCEDAELVAVADVNAPLRERAAQEFGAETFHSYQDLLEQAQVDAVFIYGDNATGVQMGVDAAAHGVDFMIEKPLAADLDGANRLLAAARKNKVRGMVNWPFSWWPQMQHALALAKDGAIGRIWEVKYRAAHRGPRELGVSKYFGDWLYRPELNGGGAFMDYCCYGTVLAQYLLGTPSKVSGTAGRFVKPDIEVEDNGVLVMTYPDAMAVAEASWSQVGYFHTYTPVIHGTEGSFMIEPGMEGKLWKTDVENLEGRTIEIPALEPFMRSATANFVHGLQTGDPFFGLGDLSLGRDTQEILEAGKISVEREAQVSLPLQG